MEVIFNNFASGTLASDINAGDVVIDLAFGEGAFFPSPIPGSEYCVLVIEDVLANKEVIHMTQRAGDTLTVVRGQEGTSGQGFLTGSRVELRATAGFFTEFVDAGTY